MTSTFTPNRNYNLQATGANVNTWGIVLNSNFSLIDQNLGGTLDISVAGNSNINLTATQAANLIHNLSGALTGNINYNFPDAGAFFFINNQTTGNFTVTVTVQGGSGGFLVPQGTAQSIYIDSSVPTVGGFVGTLPSTLLLGTSTTLSLSNSAQRIVATTTLTATLSTSSAYSKTYYNEFYASSGTITLAQTGTDTINGVNANFQVPQGASGELCTDANGHWYVFYSGSKLNLESTLASTTITDLGTAASNIVNITGFNSISSLGTSATVNNPFYITRFSGTASLVNTTNLVLPNNTNYQASVGDVISWKYENPVWRVVGSALANGGALNTPIATTSILGVVSTDGATIQNTSGAISVRIATSSVTGVVEPDGTIITVSTTGAITVPNATSSAKGVVQVDGTTITASGGTITATNIQTPFNVGSLILASCTSAVSAGSQVSYTTLTPVYLIMGGGGGVQATGDTLSGTWQALQAISSPNAIHIGLFQRVS